MNLCQASKEGDAKFQKINKDLSTVGHQLNHYHCELDDQEKTICSLHKHQGQPEERINNLMRVVDHLGVEVGHNKTIRVLEEKIADMEGCPCHCTDQGKGKGKEVVLVEESSVFNYNSDNTYCMALSMGRVKILELIPIDSNLEDREVKKLEGYKLCGCGCASHPILLSSDDNILVAENAIPIRIQVEHSPPTDQVVSGQCYIRLSGVIHTPKHPHSSKPSHIARLACYTTTSYQMVKAVEHI